MSLRPRLPALPALFACAVVSSGALAACGSDSLTELEGIYLIQTWTLNDTGCAAEGTAPPPFADDTAFYIKEETFFVKFVNVVQCADVADCRTMLGEDDTIFLNGWAFESGSDSSGWKGTTSFASTGGGAECTGSVTEHVMTSPADGQIRIESRTRDSAPFPPDSDGFCDTEAAADAAEGMPCLELEVVTATFDSDL